jgi:two-component system KDP operon response regulator KdpE
MATILVIEDDLKILRGLEMNLQFEGHTVLCATDGHEGLKKALEEQADLLLLDLMLPGLSGYDICRKVRERKPALPIVMLTAKGQEIDKVAGLDLGADDYVTKPFGVGELLARIKVALRHAARPQAGGAVLRFDRAVVDLEKRTATRDGEPLHLTPIEFRLLATLARHLGMVVTHRQLLVEVWGPSHASDTHYLRIYVKQLREKLEPDPLRPRHLVTEIGVGYRLECGD